MAATAYHAELSRVSLRARLQHHRSSGGAAEFFGTDRVPFSLDSGVTGTSRNYDRFRDVINDVNLARVLAGFHFFNSDLEGSHLVARVGRYVAKHYFQPVHRHR